MTNTKAVQKRDDTQHDRFYKVRSILSMLYACLQAEPEPKMSIDKQMIPYEGKNSQSASKSAKKKLKRWVSKSWYVVAFETSLRPMTSTSMTVEVPQFLRVAPFSQVTL